MKLLFLLIFNVSIAQTVINTNDLYRADKVSNYDCSIRAIASALDISYKEALNMLSCGFVLDKGITFSDFEDVLEESGRKYEYYIINLLYPREFIQYAPAGTYIIVTVGHLYTMKYDHGWYIYGNYNDDQSIIFYAIKVH